MQQTFSQGKIVEMNIVCVCGCDYVYDERQRQNLENENNTHNFPLMPQNRKLSFFGGRLA